MLTVNKYISWVYLSIHSPTVSRYMCQHRGPAENVDKTQPAVWLSGSCRVRCEVCRTTAFIDTDARPNNIAGTLQFGEAHANGVMPVQGIQGYRVFFANDCGEQVDDFFFQVPFFRAMCDFY